MNMIYKVYLPFFLILSAFIGILNIAMNHRVFGIGQYRYSRQELGWDHSQVVKFSIFEEMNNADGMRLEGEARAVPPRQCMPWRHMRHRHGLSVENEHATYRNIQDQQTWYSTQGRFGSEVFRRLDRVRLIGARKYTLNVVWALNHQALARGQVVFKEAEFRHVIFAGIASSSSRVQCDWWCVRGARCYWLSRVKVRQLRDKPWFYISFSWEHNKSQLHPTSRKDIQHIQHQSWALTCYRPKLHHFFLAHPGRLANFCYLFWDPEGFDEYDI